MQTNRGSSVKQRIALVAGVTFASAILIATGNHPAISFMGMSCAKGNSGPGCCSQRRHAP